MLYGRASLGGENKKGKPVEIMVRYNVSCANLRGLPEGLQLYDFLSRQTANGSLLCATPYKFGKAGLTPGKDGLIHATIDVKGAIAKSTCCENKGGSICLVDDVKHFKTKNEIDFISTEKYIPVSAIIGIVPRTFGQHVRLVGQRRIPIR